MDILRDLFDGFAQWTLERSDKQFAAGCGCGCLLILIVLGAVLAVGVWIGVRW